MNYVIYCDDVIIGRFTWEVDRDICWRALVKTYRGDRYSTGVEKEVKVS